MLWCHSCEMWRIHFHFFKLFQLHKSQETKVTNFFRLSILPLDEQSFKLNSCLAKPALPCTINLKREFHVYYVFVNQCNWAISKLLWWWCCSLSRKKMCLNFSMQCLQESFVCQKRIAIATFEMVGFVVPTKFCLDMVCWPKPKRSRQQFRFYCRLNPLRQILLGCYAVTQKYNNSNLWSQNGGNHRKYLCKYLTK